MSKSMMQRSGTVIAVVLLATVLTAGAVLAQESRPADASRFDQAQCLREAERMGRSMLEQLAREARREIEAASAKVRAMLRDVCAAGSVLASEEARIAAEKMVDEARAAAGKMVEAAITAMRGMRDALEGFYASLSDEQKRSLDAFIRPPRPDPSKPQ